MKKNRKMEAMDVSALVSMTHYISIFLYTKWKETMKQQQCKYMPVQTVTYTDYSYN